MDEYASILLKLVWETAVTFPTIMLNADSTQSVFVHAIEEVLKQV